MSRLHFLHEGARLKLFVEKGAAKDDAKWRGKTFQRAIDGQLSPFATHKINAKNYYCFDISILNLNASHHRNILDGNIYVDDLQTELYNRREGFSISIHGAQPITMPFQWMQMIEFSRELMFFGPPLSRSRLYSQLFEGLKTMSTIRATFMWMSHEVAAMLLLDMLSHTRICPQRINSYLNAMQLNNLLLHQ